MGKGISLCDKGSSSYLDINAFCEQETQCPVQYILRANSDNSLGFSR